MRILDIGCGPGTITCDLATLVPQGSITGLDTTDSVLSQARAHASQRSLTNISFAVGDVYKLDYPDASFDVVHAHQVLQHLSDPVAALREMRRVAKPGGLVAAREADVAASAWWPASQGLSDWRDLYLRVARWTGGTPDAGRRLHVLAKQAGFEREGIEAGASTWCFCSGEERAWWGGMWAERIRGSGFREKALESGFVDEAELDRLVDAWMEFVKEEDGWFTMVHGEALCRV